MGSSVLKPLKSAYPRSRLQILLILKISLKFETFTTNSCNETKFYLVFPRASEWSAFENSTILPPTELYLLKKIVSMFISCLCTTHKFYPLQLICLEPDVLLHSRTRRLFPRKVALLGG